MRLLRHKDEGNDIATAHALRRYVRNRAAGRIAPEYTRAAVVDGIGVWTGCTKDEAQPLDGKRFRQVRKTGQPWCRYLGTDTTIARDHALQAFFELVEYDAWTAMLHEVSRRRVKTLRRWRGRGREILARVRPDSHEAGTVQHPPRLALVYRDRGRGVR